MRNVISGVFRAALGRTTPPLRALRDLASLAAYIIPETRDRVSFRQFWGEGGSSGAYFVISGYENVGLRNVFEWSYPAHDRAWRPSFCEGCPVDGAFTPQAAAILTRLFARHSGKALRIVSDDELGSHPDGVLICYGTSDSNFKTFDIEAESRSRLYQFLSRGAGQRAFRVGDQIHSLEERNGILYDKAIVCRLGNQWKSNHTRVICAGLSEWGSLAAVHYLAGHWKHLHNRFDQFGPPSDFCILLEVRCGQFESVRELISAVSWEPALGPCSCLVSGHV